MIIDSLLMLDPIGSAITVTRDSTNILDMLNARDMGIGTDMALAIFISESFLAAGAGTLTVEVQSAPNNAGSPGTWTTIAKSRAYAIAELLVGYHVLPIDWPASDSALNLPTTIPRFYKLVYTVATGPFTAGKVFAAFVLDRQNARTYAAGITISN